MRYLRTNTAARVTVGPFFDKTDGVTPETALTVTSCKLTFVVDDANVPTLVLDTSPTASGGSNDMVHITGDDAGFYDLELAAANVNYLGRAMLAITDATTHCPVFHEFMILPAVVYDSMFLGTDLFDVSVTQILGTAVSSPATAGILDVNVKNINNTAAATPGASGGILISGSNAGTTTLAALTVTGSFTISDGLLVSRSSSNTSAITATGNGTGHGFIITSGSGATGDGLKVVSAATNGRGFNAVGAGSGHGMLSTGGATGRGFSMVGGATSGSGMSAECTGVSLSHGALFTGVQGGMGILATGGDAGHGIKAVGGTSAGASGLYITGSNGATGDAVTIISQSTNGNGISITGTGSGSGILFVKGSTGDGFKTDTFNATSTFTITGATTFTGAITATNASNDIVGIDIAKIKGSATAATNQKNAALGVYSGTVTGSSSSTTIVDSGLTQGDNLWNGRVVIFITGSLAGEATDITDFDAASDTLTVTTLTGSPSVSDTYVIV